GVAPYKNHARAFLDAVRVPLVMTVHEIAEPAPSAWFPVRRALEHTNRANFLHPAIQRWIVHTERDRERLITLGAEKGRIDVIPVGVPPADPMPDPETAKRDLELSGRRVVTLFGFLSSKKGHRLAIEALKQLPEDVVLLLAGDRHPDDRSEYVVNLQLLIAREGLEERVRITGYLPDMQIPQVMAATDVAVAPFLQSSGSASLAHLFANGRAIVASDIAPHREIVANEGECLLLFRSEAVDALSAALRQVLEDATLRERLQVAALGYAERHSYANMAAATVTVYQSIVSIVAPLPLRERGRG
ncbi:MAG TPA: glycosyltransferase family 4 protein, partial [Chthonomonadaceae bacterium]|nr:glycosyltransferase family 4 protein [Chthonomonadaceae bacterium]